MRKKLIAALVACTLASGLACQQEGKPPPEHTKDRCVKFSHGPDGVDLRRCDR